MSKIELKDELQRQRIAQDLDNNFMVEAGAGSGKTSCLINRMVSLIVSGRYKVEEIVAITFTRKASAELQERFEDTLLKLYQSEVDSVRGKYISDALSNMDRCFIGTVHSFCARLLRERPIEAGLDPNFKEVDKFQERELIDAAWYNFLEQSQTTCQQLLDKLHSMGLNPQDLKKEYERMSEYADVEVVTRKVDKPDLAKGVDDILKGIDGAKEFIPEQIDKYDTFQNTIFKLERYLKYFDMSKDVNMVKVISLFEKPPAVTLKRWKSKDEAKRYRDQVLPWISSQIAQPILDRWHEYCHYYITQFLKKASDWYMDMRYQSSCMNFFDLLIKTAQMLKNYPEVRSYFQQKYKCLLVDEFQDTDPIQARIMFYLTGQDVNQQDWRKLVPKKGSLFVVGDPKQSIYRFRRADISIYNQVKHLIVKSGGQVLKLSSNFRSLDCLCHWFNNVFEGLMGGQQNGYQADFVPLEPVRTPSQNTVKGVKVIDIPKECKRKDEAIAYDADCIARYIKWAVQGNVLIDRQQSDASPKACYSDFMILLKKKSGLSEYYKALKKYDIPATLAGNNSIKDYMEIKEFLKLIKFVCYPDDKILLVAVLKGIFFGASDQQLYDYKCAGGDFDIFNSSSGIFENEFSRLREYVKWRQQYSPYTVMEKVARDVGLIPLAMMGEDGETGCSYVYQLLEISAGIQSGGAEKLDQVVTQIEEMLDANILEDEISILSGSQDSVSIMNLHKAKGLEAPVVFLALSEESCNHPIGQHITREGEIPKGYFCFTKPYGKHVSKVIGQPEGWEPYREREKRYLDAEEVRLLYVAATRAKNMLVISRWNKKSSKNAWNSLIQGMDCQQLEIPQLDHVYESDASGQNYFDELKQYREGGREWVQQLQKSSIRQITPTSQRDIQDYPLAVSSEGGTEWGTAIHKILEGFLREEGELEHVIQSVLSSTQLCQHRQKDVQEIIDIFKDSHIYREFKNAEERYAEVPISCSMDDTGQVIFNGTIDLVFRQGDGWVIVDYKTDNAEEDHQFQQLAQWYSEQIKTYCRVWEKLTGQRVKAGYIYFTCGKALDVWTERG
ncbi:MAG: UvrD-helicase domain-containing protein [Clostridia bacterium]|nr:UvrD-helicase domain-containing protein [Clostridia bacterium]